MSRTPNDRPAVADRPGRLDSTQSVAISRDGEAAPPPRPGLWLVCGSSDGPAAREVPDEGIVIGRGEVGFRVEDGKASRQHTRVRMRGGLWFVDDMGSRNGTFVDGERLAAPWRGIPRVIRVGDSVFVPVRDLGPDPIAPLVEPSGAIAGPTLRRVWRRIEEGARAGLTVHVHGDSGSGKEIAARRFHEASGRRGPFVAVNCATIPAEIAERLLFGTRRGAYSGAAADAVGLIESAAGGTLFLDELAELPLPVQSKLLRVLDDGEVTPLGATSPKHVAFGLVSASNARLGDAVAGGRFREDLYYRVAGDTVVLPPLGDRSEEIAAHVERELASIPDAPRSSPEFIEACLRRRWPGNVRELEACVRRAVTEARIRGATQLRATDLVAESIEASPGALAGGPSPLSDDEAIAAALRRHGGNVSACARELGVHRTQLRRWIARTGFVGAGAADGGESPTDG